MVTASVSIDVPDLALGIRFYSEALGFTKLKEPYPGVVVMRSGSFELCLLEKAPGTHPSIRTSDVRRYVRHWTPVHLDFHVDNLSQALSDALAAGAVAEQVFENPEHGSAAFCSDPFGHGFCLIQRAAESSRPAA